MIQRIIAVYSRCKSSFDRMMFHFGYLVTAFCVGTYYHTRAIISYMRLKDKETYNEYTERLLEVGDESFDRFLNHLRPLLPDKWRQMLVYETRVT